MTSIGDRVSYGETSFGVSQIEAPDAEEKTIINLELGTYTVLQYQYIAETRIYRTLVKDTNDIRYILHISGNDVSLYNKLSNIRYRYELSNFSPTGGSELKQFTFIKTEIRFNGHTSTHIIVVPDNCVTF